MRPDEVKRSGRLAGTALAALAFAGLGACSEHHFEPPDRAAQVAAAEAQFSLAIFDSVAWESDDARGLEGNVVYATYCDNCHGPMGRGGTDYARNRDLDVPSLVEPEWPLAQARDSVLHRIFVGHVAGMPIWGIAGITPREMDAVTHYLLDVLRPEVLGS